jgi:CRISPR-associated protein Cas1
VSEVLAASAPAVASDAAPGLLPARMLNEFAYCPRLCYLEWVQGEFAVAPKTH